MKKIMIEEMNGGYVVRMAGFIKVEGPYVFKSTEVLAMLEFVGEHVADEKVRVERK